MKRFSANALLSFAVLLVIVLALSCGCGQEEKTEGKVGVAVTILPQVEFVESVGGDRVKVTVMVPPGANVHTYEPTPSQLAALAGAEMYAKVGSGVEFELAWMGKLVAVNRDMLVVDCSKGIALQEMVAEEESEGEEEPEHGRMDPHIWMSPWNAQIMVRNICEGLVQVDPDHKNYYEQNRDVYLQKLAELDREIKDRLSGLTNRRFMVYHPAFGYFASEYNLVMMPIEAGGKEPTAAGLARQIAQAKEHGIKVIFTGPQFNPQSAEVVARAIGGVVVYIDPLAKDYLVNMRRLLNKLVQVME